MLAVPHAPGKRSYGVDGHGFAVEPGTNHTRIDIAVRAPEYQKGANRRGPGRAAFWRRANKNIVIAGNETVPTRGIIGQPLVNGRPAWHHPAFTKLRPYS